MKTKSGELVDLLTAILTSSTNAGSQVFKARTWPLKLAAVPALMIDPVYIERKESTGRAAPEFDVTTMVKIRGRVTSPAGLDDAGADICEDALEALKSQIERALINAYPVMLTIERFASIETEFTVTSEAAQNVGELQMTVAMEFKEGPEDFAPIDTSTLGEVAVYPDMANVFDPAGTYTGQHPFPGAVQPAPRTSGPDGRVEGGGLLIDIDP